MDIPDPADIFAKAGSSNNQSTEFEGAMPVLTYKRAMFIQDGQCFQRRVQAKYNISLGVSMP